jgi:predicted flap endonuclease-1-like 5' DNA nuclease
VISLQILAQALPILALLAGSLLGWGVSATHNRRSKRRARNVPGHHDRQQLKYEDMQGVVHAAEVTLEQLEVRLSFLNKSIAAARQQVEEQEWENDRLLVTLDERQASVKDAQNNLQAIRSSLQTRTREADSLLENIDHSIEELDLLAQMKEGYGVKINRLTQQVQWQDSELRMLRQTVKAKTKDLDDARALLDQRDSELRLIIRQRQQREIDIEHARQSLAHRTDELRRQVGSSGGDPFISERPPARLPAQRIDVTPLLPRPVSAPTSAPASARPAIELEMEDDLTVIPRLADFYARQLKENGVKTIRQLASLNEDQVRSLLNIPAYHSPNIEGWLKAARRLTRKRRPGKDSGSA